MIFPWDNWDDNQKCAAELFLCLIEDLCELLPNCSQKINFKIVSMISELILKFKSKSLCNF